MENVTVGEVDAIPKEIRVVLSVIVIAITIIGICGNTLVFIAYCLSRRLQTKTNMFVINLAAADILTCVFLPVIVLSLLLDANVNTKPWLDTLCAVDTGAIKIFLLSSFATLAFVGVNRYVLITKSRETYKRIYQRKFIFIFLCICWLYPMLCVTLPTVFGFLHFGYDEKIHACREGPDHPRSYVYGTLVFIHIFLPVTMIVYCYGQIYLFLRHHHKQMLKSTVKKREGEERATVSKLLRSVRDAGRMTSRKVSQNQVDIIKNLFYVLVSFFICFAPYTISKIFDAHYLVLFYTKFLVLFNSCVNPILYGVNHPHFRQVFYSILSRQWSKIPEPAFRWMNSGSSRLAVSGSKSNDLDLTVSEKSDKV
ncbi:G-protein coupled receptor moody [Holothuria leucospilota]|uniref:G-protein coupled receptor moody n=1 Tax=Holothuria leucospilota TaxID=206669 RepID=A0A9Q1BE29_HOLLE|nr:G-protein coupled receptor moody [Holothuria leucospilota]